MDPQINDPTNNPVPGADPNSAISPTPAVDSVPQPAPDLTAPTEPISVAMNTPVDPVTSAAPGMPDLGAPAPVDQPAAPADDPLAPAAPAPGGPVPVPGPGPMQTGGAMPETSPSGSAKKSFPMPLLIGVAVVLVVAIAALLFL